MMPSVLRFRRRARQAPLDRVFWVIAPPEGSGGIPAVDPELLGVSVPARLRAAARQNLVLVTLPEVITSVASTDDLAYGGCEMLTGAVSPWEAQQVRTALYALPW